MSVLSYPLCPTIDGACEDEQQRMNRPRTMTAPHPPHPPNVSRASFPTRTFRKAILSAFLLLCSHGKKNDIAMLRKFLRKVLGISLRLRRSLRKVLGIRSTNGW